MLELLMGLGLMVDQKPLILEPLPVEILIAEVEVCPDCGQPHMVIYGLQ